MKTLALILAFAATSVLGDGFGHSGSHRNGRRGGRQQRFRQGRQEAAPLGNYGADGAQPTYTGDGDTLGSPTGGDDNLAMLEKSVPGIPGEDYPIYAEVPETAFACDGQVDGGYYADPEADCQVFHICTADGQGGLAKYSFLCPNGTVFNQNYFICDWWFNFDCAEAENLYSLNEDIAAEREANSQAGASDEPQSGYGAATSSDYDYAAGGAADYDYAAATEAPVPTYAAEEETAAAPAEGGYASPDAEAPQNQYDAGREGRNFRGNFRQGRNFRGNSNRNGRRNNNRRRPGRRGRQGRRFRG